MSDQIDWNGIKEKVMNLVRVEKRDAERTITLSHIPKVMDEVDDDELVFFFEQANTIGEDVFKTLFNTDNINALPVEFSDHEDYADLTFKDKSLFEITFKLLHELFYGDLVRDVVQDNRRTLENLMRELQRIKDNIR